jgi:hypothetical protein
MAATPSTGVYTTLKDAVVTIGSTSYAKARVAELPGDEAGVVNVPHASGFQKLADGLTDYGRFRLILPEDGSASRVGSTITTFTVAIVYPDASTKTWTCTSVYCTKDGGATFARGQAGEREFIGECLVAHSVS